MHLRREAAVLVLTFTLATPLAAADPRLESRDRAERPAVSISSFLSHAWSLFTSLWGTASTGDEGPGADPLGGPTTDEGPGMDPLG